MSASHAPSDPVASSEPAAPNVSSDPAEPAPRPRPAPWRLGAVLTPLVSATLGAALVLALTTIQANPTEAEGAPTGAVTGVVAPTGIRSVAYTQALASAKTRKPKVTVIGTGGTISGVATSRSSFTDYRSGQIAIASMVGQLQPEIGQVADVSTVQFGNKGSGGYTIAEFHALTLAVQNALKSADAVVVTTGTDTMEEFAYWLDLTVQSQQAGGAHRRDAAVGGGHPGRAAGDRRGRAGQPLQLDRAGGQPDHLLLRHRAAERRRVPRRPRRHQDQFLPDGHLPEPRARRAGLGRRAEHQGRPGAGPGRRLRPDQGLADARSTCPGSSRRRCPGSRWSYSYQQAGGEAISGFAAAGVKGIVTAGTGGGGISSAQSSARTAAAAQGVVFVSTTRTGSGSVYGGSSTAPIIAGDDLLPQKARLLLLLSLAFAPTNVDRVREWVTTLGNPEWDTAPASQSRD